MRLLDCHLYFLYYYQGLVNPLRAFSLYPILHVILHSTAD